MGNYNGDMTDDLMLRNSTDPLHHNAILHDIHYQFGITWFNSINQTMFTYNERIGQSWDSLYEPNYRPLFSNDPSLESVCGNDTFCMFDVASTGCTDIGLSTLNAGRDYEEILELLLPIVCNPPCVQGACVANDTCNCMMGYVGERCDEAVYEDCNVTDVEICNNGGSCRKLRPSYICECLDGFTGINCQTVYNGCNDTVCANSGVCRPMGFSYICECLDGYTGINCQAEIDENENAKFEYQTLIIVLAVVVTFLLLVVIALVVYFCCCRKKGKYHV